MVQVVARYDEWTARATDLKWILTVRTVQGPWQFFTYFPPNEEQNPPMKCDSVWVKDKLTASSGNFIQFSKSLQLNARDTLKGIDISFVDWYDLAGNYLDQMGINMKLFLCMLHVLYLFMHYCFMYFVSALFICRCI